MRPLVRRAAGTAGCLLIVFSMAAGCAGGRNVLGTTASPCFRALPGAETAVHHKGRLVGVRRIKPDTLSDHLPPAVQHLSGGQELCVFAFHGTYPPGSVVGGDNKTTLPYAVIAVTSKSLKPVASFVLLQLPTRFRHVT